MIRMPMSAAGLLLLVAGCGLIVDLPDARIEEDEAPGVGGSTPSGDGDEMARSGASGLDGDGDGDGDGGSGGESTGGVPEMGGAAHPSGGAQETGGESASGGADGGCESPCDCDGDGALRSDVECGGTDCDDSDARVFPDQTQYFSSPANEEIGFDYNCDSVIQRPEGQSQAINCAALTIGSCSSVQGFEEVPACGGRADWGKCINGSLASCVFSVLEADRVVRCR